ncbi:MAG: putative asparagine synthetase [glutamine-hydrolyzing] [Nitrosomonadaceae bacterium]|nr:putative asparagine synthetase [glutamine-hydrolyzing] [Nitrosomonadaceae bacterium]
MQYFDIKTYLSEDILVKVDKASMLNSLEVRNPFLDHKVIELAARIPSRLKLKGYDKKYILKKMMMPELGREFLYRKKRGFGMPLGRWFKEDLGDYLQDTLMGADSFTSAYIDNTALRRMIAQHRSGQRDLSNALWSVLFLEQWGRIFMRQSSKG